MTGKAANALGECITLEAAPYGSRTGLQYAQMDLRAHLEHIQCPTLVVTGALDWSTPPADHELIAKKMPNARLAIIEGASHTGAGRGAGEEFNRLTLGFLDQNIS